MPLFRFQARGVIERERFLCVALKSTASQGNVRKSSVPPSSSAISEVASLT